MITQKNYIRCQCKLTYFHSLLYILLFKTHDRGTDSLKPTTVITTTSEASLYYADIRQLLVFNGDLFVSSSKDRLWFKILLSDCGFSKHSTRKSWIHHVKRLICNLPSILWCSRSFVLHYGSHLVSHQLLIKQHSCA